MRLDDGILLVDKPAGPTSAGVVRDVKRRLAISKVGHLGTLDPFATGLLPLCLGEGAKAVPFLNEADKAYAAVIRLGSETDTGDVTGEVVSEAPVPEITAGALESARLRFLGEIDQAPPMYSAIKQGGVRLHRLARKGIEVDRPFRRVIVTELELLPIDPTRLAMKARCSKGTYVRVLGADLAGALGTVGTLESLRRTRFGAWRVEEAVELDDVQSDPAAARAGFRTVDEVLEALPSFAVDEGLEARIRAGQQEALEALPAPGPDTAMARVLGPDGSLVAVIEARRPLWRIRRVFRCHG